jgi:iron complex outermembrane receptor protein
MKQLFYFIYVLFIFTLPAGSLYAQDSIYKSSVMEVMQIRPQSSWHDIEITSASKSEEGASKAPAMIRVVTEEQIKMRCYRSINDVLQDLPEVKIDGWAHEQNYNVVSFRGLYANNYFIILLDGVKISAPTNEGLPLIENYPVHAVKQIEIVYGAGSALYGADAVSGIINIVTKNGDKKTSLEVSPMLGNYGTYTGQIFFSKRISDDFLCNASASYHHEGIADVASLYGMDLEGYKTGTFKTGFGPMTPRTPFVPRFEAETKSHAVNVNLKSRGFEFLFFHNYARTPNSFPNDTKNTIMNKDVFFANSITVGSMGYEKNFDKIKLNSQIISSIHQIDPHSNYRNVYVGLERGYKYGYANMLKFDQQLFWRINTKSNFIVGGTYEHFQAIPKTADLSKPVNPDKPLTATYLNTDIEAEFFAIRYANLGAYAQYKYNGKKTSLTLGARYDYNSRFGGTFNPRLGFVYTPASALTLRLTYATAYFAPNPETAYSHYGSFYFNESKGEYASFFWHLPNPDLKPIFSENFEFGIRYTVNDNWILSLNSYYNRLTNLFDVISDKEHNNIYNGKFKGYDVDYIQVSTNLGNRFNYGFCLQSEYRRTFAKGSFYTYSSLSFVESELNGMQAGLVTPIIFKAGFDWQVNKFSFSPRVIMTGEQRHNQSVPNNPKIKETAKGFTLVNFAIRYAFFKKSYVFLNVQNALDARFYYPNFGSGSQTELNSKEGSPQLPLRAQIGLQLNF